VEPLFLVVERQVFFSVIKWKILRLSYPLQLVFRSLVPKIWSPLSLNRLSLAYYLVIVVF
jgi:hypothetical protein